jgi:hypothetical protein
MCKELEDSWYKKTIKVLALKGLIGTSKLCIYDYIIKKTSGSVVMMNVIYAECRLRTVSHPLR